MTAETLNEDDDPVAELARIIYAQMNVEPRQMHIAIECARQYLTEIRAAPIQQRLRTSEDGESPFEDDPSPRAGSVRAES